MTIQGAAYCVSSKVHYKEAVPTLEEARKYLKDPILATRFSPKSIRIAIAYGFVEDLKEYAKLNTGTWNRPSQKSQKLKDLQTKIQDSINFARLDINSMASEISCYLDRFTEILTVMKEKEDGIVRDNTLYAIATAAVAAIIDGGTAYTTSLNQMVIISSGLILSYFSYKAFNPKVTVDFRPKSSNLKELWYESETTDNFSTAIWFLMNKKVIEDELTVRELLVKRWIENGFLGEEGEEREKMINLYFGTGGISSIQNIFNRREMNNQMKTLIQLFEQDIRALQVELISGKNDKTETPPANKS